MPPEDKPVENTSSPLKQIRTYQGDVAEALQRQKESLVSIQQAEHIKRQSLGTMSEATEGSGNKKKFFLLLGTLILLALGAVGVWYTYFQYKSQTAVPVLTTPENRFFSIDSEENLSVASSSRLDFIHTISIVEASVAPSETKQFLLNIKTAELFKILETRAPGSLTRALGPEFMLGAYGPNNFLIFKLTSFENTFAGMLNWEANIAMDIGPLFSTRELLRDSTSTPVFIDVTDRNKDIRALFIGSKYVMLYSFFDNQMLIITDDMETMRVLIERLEREKLSR